MIQRKLISTPAAWPFNRSANAAILGFWASLLGCSGESVNMGENDVQPAPLPSSSRCLESATLDGDVIVRNQEEVNALEGCEVIEGDLHIVAFEGADLRALHALKTVREKLNVGSTEVLTSEELEFPDPAAAQALRERWLESLHGLEALESVGALSLNGYAGRNVDPLSSLQYITDGLLDIQHNSELEGLDGLRNAKGIRSLYVGACPDLYGIEALALPEQMTELRLEFTGLSRLGELDVHTITGTLSIDHTELRNLDELSSLTYAGSIHIEANFSLQNVDGLNGLGRAESIEFEFNVSLEHLPEFSNLVWLDSFRAVYHPKLATLPSFPVLAARSRGTFAEYLAENPTESILLQPDLFDVSGNDQLTAVTVPAGWFSGGAVVIDGNPALARIDFTEQSSIEYLSIQNNPALSAVGLGALDTVSHLDLIDNPNLQLSVFDPIRTFRTNAAGNAAE